jgi:hypothetical protein
VPETLRRGTVAPPTAVSWRRCAGNRTLTEEPITYCRSVVGGALGSEALLNAVHADRRPDATIDRCGEKAQKKVPQLLLKPQQMAGSIRP